MIVRGNKFYYSLVTYPFFIIPSLLVYLGMMHLSSGITFEKSVLFFVSMSLGYFIGNLVRRIPVMEITDRVIFNGMVVSLKTVPKTFWNWPFQSIECRSSTKKKSIISAMYSREEWKILLDQSS